MAQHFICADRDQTFLMPPSLREWLPADHLAWFVLDAVAEMDLAAFYADYRADGHGRPAHDPGLMVALVLYAHAVGERSLRKIERRCVEDVAFRVIAGNLAPDHSTIGRFVERHEGRLEGLFAQVLALCARAGLVRAGTVALDSTKIAANASGPPRRAARGCARPSKNSRPSGRPSAARARRCSSGAPTIRPRPAGGPKGARRSRATCRAIRPVGSI